MDVKTALAISLPLVVGIAAFGSALGLGKVVSSAMEATGISTEIGKIGKVLQAVEPDYIIAIGMIVMTVG